MNVLVIGGGGREHALCRAVARSAIPHRLYCAPGNAGIAAIARCVPLDWRDSDGVIAFCRDQDVRLVVIGPEAPLAAGLGDILRAAGVAVVGPNKEAARLESSKRFMREICVAEGIPAPRHGSFSDGEAAKSWLAEQFAVSEAAVVKADGLAAGKGVIIAADRSEASTAIDALFRQGHACVLIEERLRGREASFFFLCRGEDALPFGEARDYKRIGEDDTGANTGGMGAYSPLPDVNDAIRAAVSEGIIAPALRAMTQRGTPFTGFLYAGVMLTASGPQLLEFNVRLGDPEAQVILPRLRSDFLALLLANATAPETPAPSLALPLWDERGCLGVVMASAGYPGAYRKGDVISGAEDAAIASAGGDVCVFHAGTRRDESGRLCTDGGRVLCASALGADMAAARRRAYETVARITWRGAVHRRDIGRDIGRGVA